MATYEQMNSLGGVFKYTPDQVYSMFPHLKKSTVGLYKSKIDKYLISEGFQGEKAPRASKVSEIVMFMEIAFQGKYKEKLLTHYQYITLPKNGAIPKGDSLSEKIKGCESKNAFNNYFSLIGTTFRLDKEILHTTLDFKGKLYLRVIDTQDNNKSYFFRNDLATSEFIKAVENFNPKKINPKCLINKYIKIKSGEGSEGIISTKLPSDVTVNATKTVEVIRERTPTNSGVVGYKFGYTYEVVEGMPFYKIRESQLKEQSRVIHAEKVSRGIQSDSEKKRKLSLDFTHTGKRNEEKKEKEQKIQKVQDYGKKENLIKEKKSIYHNLNVGKVENVENVENSVIYRKEENLIKEESCIVFILSGRFTQEYPNLFSNIYALGAIPTFVGSSNPTTVSSLYGSSLTYSGMYLGAKNKPLDAFKLHSLGVGSLLAIQSLLGLVKLMPSVVKYSRLESYSSSISLSNLSRLSKLLNLPAIGSEFFSYNYEGLTELGAISVSSISSNIPTNGFKLVLEPRYICGEGVGTIKGVKTVLWQDLLELSPPKPSSRIVTPTYPHLFCYNPIGDVRITPLFASNCTVGTTDSVGVVASNCKTEVQATEDGVLEMAKSTGKGLGYNAKVVQAQFTNIEPKTFKDYITRTNADGTPFVTSKDVYTMWRDAILFNKLTKVTLLPYTYVEAAKESASYGQMFIKYSQGHDYETFPEFLNVCMKGWSSLRLHLKPYWAEVATFNYPTITTFNYLFDHVLVWHDNMKNNITTASSLSSALKANFNKPLPPKPTKVSSTSESGITTNTPDDYTLQSEGSKVYSNVELDSQEGKLSESIKVNVPSGYTYLTGKKFGTHGEINPTYEERYADALRKGDKMMMSIGLKALKEKSKDFEGSMLRVKQLIDVQPA